MNLSLCSCRDRFRTTNNMLGDCYTAALVEHWSRRELAAGKADGITDCEVGEVVVRSPPCSLVESLACGKFTQIQWFWVFKIRVVSTFFSGRGRKSPNHEAPRTAVPCGRFARVSLPLSCVNANIWIFAFYILFLRFSDDASAERPSVTAWAWGAAARDKDQIY